MIVVLLVVLGLVLGSFTNALVWRLHEQAKLADKKSTAKNRSRRQALSVLRGRSMCPGCEHVLAVRDLVPVLSWLSLRGKCRYCHQPIAWQYPLVELAVVGLFVGSYCFWPLALSGVGLFEFIVWLVFLVGFAALAAYDFRWKILPNRIIYPLIMLALIRALVVVTVYGGGWRFILGVVWGVAISAGLFFVLFELSQGRWIGGGDVKLGVIIGLIIGGPARAVLMLFLASVLGTLSFLPFVATGKMDRTSQIPFGPFLLAATTITYLFGGNIITWYSHVFIR